MPTRQGEALGPANSELTDMAVSLNRASESEVSMLPVSAARAPVQLRWLYAASTTVIRTCTSSAGQLTSPSQRVVLRRAPRVHSKRSPTPCRITFGTPAGLRCICEQITEGRSVRKVRRSSRRTLSGCQAPAYRQHTELNERCVVQSIVGMPNAMWLPAGDGCPFGMQLNPTVIG